MIEIIFSPAAFADLDEIFDFIAMDSIDAAGRLRAEFEEAVAQLSIMPNPGHASKLSR